jgi:uncharacterized membrane protein
MPLRRHEVTRLEGFSDAVFGFALTLLVVSLDVPNNVDELLKDMQGLVGFALTFAMVCWIWYEHNVFFRSYGLQDQWTVFLNCVLLFVVLFYVYPLKFLTAALMRQFFGIGREDGPSFHGSSANDGAALMLLYSSGIVLLFFVFVMLYRHAWKKRAELNLDQKEELSLRYGQRAHLLSMGLGIASLMIVLVNPNMAPIAGMIYGLMGPLHAWNGYQSGKAHSQLDKRMASS